MKRLAYIIISTIVLLSIVGCSASDMQSSLPGEDVKPRPPFKITKPKKTIPIFKPRQGSGTLPYPRPLSDTAEVTITEEDNLLYINFKEGVATAIIRLTRNSDSHTTVIKKLSTESCVVLSSVDAGTYDITIECDDSLYTATYAR